MDYAHRVFVQELAHRPVTFLCESKCRRALSHQSEDDIFDIRVQVTLAGVLGLPAVKNVNIEPTRKVSMADTMGLRLKVGAPT